MTRSGHSVASGIFNLMESDSLFTILETANDKPAAFSVYTAKELWTDQHTSEQMLAFHLNGEIDVSSRRTSFIEGSVRWMASCFDLSPKSRIIDFGCGPGLYTSRFADLGAAVYGVDFSARSIEYAREFADQNGLDISYTEADYLEYRPEGEFNLITMIMCDYCALSPKQRAALLVKFKELLSEGGRIVLDVYSLSALADKKEVSFYEKNQLNGFWSAEPYYAFVSSFKYEEEKVSLDKYTIIERGRQREVYNWLQYFTPQSLENEARAAGLEIEATYADVAGKQYDSNATEFAVVMTKP
jgi:SAM-dependent methyltransferase